MDNYSVESILAEKNKIVLPECTYCKSRCWECIYFETNAPDAKGQCRCAYFGRWYFPSEGCGNGKSKTDYRKEQEEEYARRQEEERRRRRREEMYVESERKRSADTQRINWSGTGNTGGSTGSSTDGGGGLLGLIMLFLAGSSILFSMGLIKPTITFKLESSSMSAEQYVEHTVNVVRMDDGSNSYPKNFKGYTVYREALNEKGRSYMDLVKGSYDVWLSYDGVSGFSGEVSVNNAFDKDNMLDISNLEKGSVKVAVFYLQGKLGRQIIVDNLVVKDSEGNMIPCTAYGEDGQYIMTIPDSLIDQGRASVTVYVEGYEAKEIELNFSESRITEVKVKLSAE